VPCPCHRRSKNFRQSYGTTTRPDPDEPFHAEFGFLEGLFLVISWSCDLTTSLCHFTRVQVLADGEKVLSLVESLLSGSVLALKQRSAHNRLS